MAYSSSAKAKTWGDPLLAAKHPPRPSLLLKDYLRDDLSSCSSSGFKSLPRRQCCMRPPCSSSCSSSLTRSSLQKASETVMNAIKSLPIPSRQKSKANKVGGVLCRSLSRKKLLSKRFWRIRAPFSSTASVSSSASASNIDRYSWAEDSRKMETNNSSIANSTSTGGWPNEDKEQFSPVSVLDFALFDDDGEISSPFNISSTCSPLEGTKHMQHKSRRHFDRVASLKPVALEKRIAWSGKLEDETIHNHPSKPCSAPVPIMCTQNGNSNNVLLRDNAEENARNLLDHVKRSIPSASECLIIEVEKLLFDFFKQSIEENNEIEISKKSHLCKVAEDWIRGQPQELCLGRLVREERQVYIGEMDKGWEWRNSEEEIQQLALELEFQLFTSLVDELVLDLITTC